MYSQQSFSRLWEGYATDKDALKARNEAAKRLRSEGKRVVCSTLRNQLKKYDGFGQPNGGICNVYMLTIL
jgi:hypothetical protein